ncbi:hypothetical protein AY599_07215 [Leptolyngbya valderiana BDU 20041]|nr:hypothetical protein AY599_07215 [Leptolyngbya valderiana BDU 20041]
MSIGNILSCILLIPAGLAGVGAGLHEMWLAGDALPSFIDQLRQLSATYQPWIEGIFSLFIGASLLLIAALLGLRGLQS